MASTRGITAGDVGALNLSAGVVRGRRGRRPDLGRTAIILTARIGETFLRDLRARVFRHLLDLGLDFFEREQTGRLVARMTSDIDALQELVQAGLTAMSMNVLMFFGAVIVIFVLSWQLALCTLIVVPPAVFATRWFRRESNRAYLDVRERIGTNLATLQEGLAGVRVVQAFGREKAFTGRFRSTNEAQYEANMETIRIATRYFPFMETLGIAATAVIIGIGGFFTDQGIVSVGTVAAFVLYLNSLFEPVQQLSQQYNIVQQSGAALNKLFGLLDEKPSIFERPGAVDLPADGAIEVSDLSFGYGSGRDVLHDVNLVIAPGERLALVGPTGAGKSTLAKLIVRFYDPRHGAVKMGGVDLRDATMALAAAAHRRRPPGGLPLHRHGARQRAHRPSRRDRRRGGSRDRSPRCRRSLRGVAPSDSTPKSVSGDRACRAANGSSCRWHVPRSPTPRSSCSTKPRRASIREPSASWSSRSTGSPRIGPWSSSRTGSPPPRAPTASVLSTTASSPSSVRTTS